jgi:type II secretion system (T2SS) protein M
MKWSAMSAKDRRAIVLGACVLIPALLYVWGFRPYSQAMAETRDQLETARLALSREKAAVLSARADPGAQRNADSALAMAAPRMFQGRDDAFASSQLASYLGGVARHSRVLMQDANTRPSTTNADGIRTLRVEIRAESDIRGIVTFLQNLEGGQKLVRVDRLEISRVPGLEDKTGYETLSVAATISGFAFAGGSTDTTVQAAPKGGTR